MIKDSDFDTFFLTKKSSDDQPEDFSCMRCGVCCSKFQALLNLEEVDRIADGLRISRTEFLEKYTDKRWGATQSFLLLHQNGACIFLVREDEGNLTSCSIDSFKPGDCRAWMPHPDKPECREGLVKRVNSRSP